MRDQIRDGEPEDESLAAIPEAERPKHVEAKKIARLLVSEIKLYNEAKVAVGRKEKDLYERLKEDIERSRATYDERVDKSIAGSTDYFKDELVATLADNEHVFYLDVNSVFLRPDGTIDPELMPDLLHPSPAGAQKWAEAMEPLLAKLFGDDPRSTMVK